MQAFANQAAIAIESARLFNSLKQSLEEVTELKNLMDSVFNSMASGVITTDTEQTIQLCNPAARHILGNESLQVVGKHVDEILPGLTDIIQYYLKRTIDLGITSTGIEASENMPERGRVDLRFSFAPFVDKEETVQGVAVVMEDETETRKLKAQRRLFGRMVSPAVIDQLDAEHLDLTGRRVELSTLFADIRGFTSFSERTSPDRLFKLLNLHLAHAVGAILSEEGTIDKFQGDAVMAWFNAPIQQKDHPIRAIRAALEIQKQVTRFHQRVQTDDQLSFGVGIHVGEAMLGLVGTKQRLEYTAVGDSVNTAKRVQENAKAGQILITETLFQLVKDRINVNQVDPILVKGKQKPLLVYEVIDLK
ncbi:MAG: PAS domain-containing protein [Anaerolineaceae bacterium]|nr:PAS domain-containing protein [Anaerolineaceae bacterium]